MRQTFLLGTATLLALLLISASSGAQQLDVPLVSNPVNLLASEYGAVDTTIESGVLNKIAIAGTNVIVSLSAPQFDIYYVRITVFIDYYAGSALQGTTLAVIKKSNDGSGHSLVNTVFDDQAAREFYEGASPYTGPFKPSDGILSDLNGDPYPQADSMKVRVIFHNESYGTTSPGSITKCTVMFNAGVYANCQVSVPWYVDSAPVNTGLPPSVNGSTSIVYLHNNLGRQLRASICYYTASGFAIGPWGDGSVFTIEPSASIAFRPVADDPATTEFINGQENPASGELVPNRPMTGENNDGKKNGSIVIRWYGSPTDVQGIVKTWTKSSAGVMSDAATIPPAVAIE